MSRLIFDTVHCFLLHRINNWYRNDPMIVSLIPPHIAQSSLWSLRRSIVPRTISIVTLLYHGTTKEEIPSSPEWTATDSLNIYRVFCFWPEDFQLRDVGISPWLLSAHSRFCILTEVVQQSFSEVRWTVKISCCGEMQSQNGLETTSVSLWVGKSVWNRRCVCFLMYSIYL